MARLLSVVVPENNETAGFGADLIADQSVFDALVGQDIATAQIDVKAGATLTQQRHQRCAGAGCGFHGGDPKAAQRPMT